MTPGVSVEWFDRESGSTTVERSCRRNVISELRRGAGRPRRPQEDADGADEPRAPGVLRRAEPVQQRRHRTDAFAVGGSRPSTPGHGQLSFEVDIDPVGRLSEVQPWLRRYTASIISMIPSRLPRRTIAAFIHKVPTRYMNLVADMLNLIIQTEAPPGNGPSDTPPWRPFIVLLGFSVL
ncbi:hypothetical protein B0T24DRAFT_712367 [Lasiosphaeria ovina]|uniref:Uncharacterized protein n=1 Tax=Lasiosphaeria ovina TaxID=92902 RepID=A0AAE0JV80_9PEZI|nr:hypothetical protein B0T24DRAFT_712367 [Lasiosphaeria ovina]